MTNDTMRGRTNYVQTELGATAELRQTAEAALMAANGQVTELRSNESSLVIGRSQSITEEEMDVLVEDERPYPETLESEQSEYDTWLG